MTLMRKGLAGGCLLLAAMITPAASPQDTARISRLESEVQQLRRQVDEQARRIQRLEEALKARSEGAAKASAVRPISMASPNAVRPPRKTCCGTCALSPRPAGGR